MLSWHRSGCGPAPGGQVSHAWAAAAGACAMPHSSPLHRPPPHHSAPVPLYLQVSFERAYARRSGVTQEQMAVLHAFLQGEDAHAMSSARCREVAEHLGMPYQAVSEREVGAFCMGCSCHRCCMVQHRLLAAADPCPLTACPAPSLSAPSPAPA